MSNGAARCRGVGRGWTPATAPLLALLLLTSSLLASCAGQQGPRVRPSQAEQTTAEMDSASSDDGDDLVPGQVVVQMHQGERLNAFLDEIVGGDLRLLDTIPELRAAVLDVPVGQEEAWIAELSADPRVEVAERNAVLRALTIPDDPIYKEFQWGFRKIGMEPVWDVSTGSPNVTVAVLDTGVDEAHPDLEPNVIDGYDFVNDDPDAWDDSSHGTHVAGVIAALGNNGEGTAGMAWSSKIMPVKVLDSKGLGPDAAVSKGIIYAVENKAKIINLSSGTPYQSKLLEDAVRFAELRGVLVVAAAGNTGDKGNEVIYPAAYASVLAVGAADEKDAAPPFSQRQPYVDIAAPGVDIPGPAWRDGGNGPYILHTGTSAAAPHVSGLAALLLSIKGDQTPAQLRELITSTADEVNPRSRDALGAGRINAFKSVNMLRPVPIPTRPAVRPTATPERLPGTPVVPQAPRIVLPSIRPLPQPGPLPSEPISWYFADGNTTTGYDTWIVIQNPMAAPAHARVAFLTQDGPIANQTVMIPPNSRKSIHVNEVVPNALVATRIDSETPVFAERTIYFGHDANGGIGTRSGARSWYLAEGSTQPPFDTWILLLNPNDQETLAHLTFMLESGETVEVDQPLAAQSRISVDVNDVIPSAGFATEVRADLPIVVERSMYFDQGGGGHGTIGVKTPGKTWFLAEGDSRPGYDTWILLQNPNEAEVANVTVTFIKDDGTTQLAYYALDPRTRLSLFADTVVPNATFGARIDSDQQIIVERSIYVANGAGGHASAAMQIPETEWYLPEGSTRSPYREVLALLNPNTETTQVDVTFTRPDGQPAVTQTFFLQPTSRLTVDVATYVPDSDISTRVIADHPIVVERSMYWDRGATSSPGLTR